MSRLRIEQGDPGTPVGTATPRLSWLVDAEESSWIGNAAEIEYKPTLGPAVRAIVQEAHGVLVEWPFNPLASREAGTVRVRVRGECMWSRWSEYTCLEAGLLGPEDWSAQFISARTLGGLNDGAFWMFRDFELDERPTRARLYSTAHGIYEATLNGVRIGENALEPGWTAYQHRLHYQTADVTASLRIGSNTLAAILGNGWYRGQLVWPGNRSSYGDRLALLAQLELEFADGSRRIITTDEKWAASPSGILADDLYDGETRDLRIAHRPDPSSAEPTEVLDTGITRLTPRRGPAVRVTSTVAPVATFTTPSGSTVVDFGQNLVGWVEIRTKGLPGDAVRVRHAEVLENGELALRPLRSAKATCNYILSGQNDVLRPTFTFNGFRYIDVTGVEDLEIDDIRALVLGSDLRRTGWFETSDPLVNRLHENVVWSMRGNFLSIPTDCPQRDERLGWTGDLAMFAPTASYLFDTSGFLADWLEDLAAEQKPDGGVPFIIPDVFRDDTPAAAGWGDAATIVPMVLHGAFADKGVLARQYPSMRAWVDKVSTLATDHLWTGGFQFGDWLDPTAPPDDPGRAKADPDVVATCFYAHSSELLARAASELGHKSDADHYGALAGEIRRAFNQNYVADDGTIRSDCQTVYALALCFDLIQDEGIRKAAGDRLADLVKEAKYRVSTGFLGTPFILEALCVAGYPDLAHSMLLETGIPSWLYPVTMGATTVWERWDSMLPDGTVNPGTMTSFNHYAFGAVADWLHRSVGGLSPSAPGWSRVRVQPLVDGRLKWAWTAHESPHGRIECRWRLAVDDSIQLEVHVPVGVTADVWVPGVGIPQTVGPGVHHFLGHKAQPRQNEPPHPRVTSSERCHGAVVPEKPVP